MRWICDKKGDDSSESPSNDSFMVKYSGRIIKSSTKKTRKAAFKYFVCLNNVQIITIHAVSFTINLPVRLNMKIALAFLISSACGKIEFNISA